jgi:putative glutamine amidotransferase
MLAYGLAEPGLRHLVQPDVSRRIMPFIDRWPEPLVKALGERPPEDFDGLVDLYLRHAPSRNHGLDMLCRAVGESAASPRPTFHVRFPECRVDEPGWTLARAWAPWCAVERAAAEREVLEALKAEWGARTARGRRGAGRDHRAAYPAMSGRPCIGVILSRRSAWRIFPLIALHLRLAGARGLRWIDDADGDLDAVDGLIIGGGDDIAPALYGAERLLEARIDPDRDAMELRVVREAFARSLPVLGICRGAQMLNVALGGSLHQDAYAVYPSRRFRTVLPRKTVHIEPGTRLAKLAGTAHLRVNAMHSQAVDRLGEGLIVAARDDGGMVQAIERTSDPFALGVQWHPEHLFFARRQRALFHGLAAAARAARENRSQTAAVSQEGTWPDLSR